MTPFERLKEGLEKSQKDGCKTNREIAQFQRDYEQHAHEADRCLQEKQEQEFRKSLSNNS